MGYRTKTVVPINDFIFKGLKPFKATIPPPVWEQIDPKPGSKETSCFVFPEPSKLDIDVRRRRK